MLPKVVILLATFNGLRWLPEQIDSILAQENVSVRIIALDDASTDGTREWLVEQAAADARLTVLPPQGSSGSSAANFYRLISQVEPTAGELIAFADQDDVWRQGKLAKHTAIMTEGGHDGVSSNVMSFDQDGRRALVRKNFPQRRFDYLFESPGPGSTFLITPRLLRLSADALERIPTARHIEFHDSLVYAIARAHGWSWNIDGEPSVDYRQHADNVMGSNIGLRPALARLGMIRGRWLRNHAIGLAQVAIAVSSAATRPQLEHVLMLFMSHGLQARLQLVQMAGELRRRPRDRWIIGFLIAIGIW